jgi:hypothetical protein
MLDTSFDQGTEYYRSSAFFAKQDFIFTKKGAKPLKTMADLEAVKG